MALVEAAKRRRGLHKHSPKVLLLRPPQLFYFGVWPRGPRLSVPIGLLSIASVLKRSNVDVEIFDCFVETSTDAFGPKKHSRRAPSGNFVRRWMRRFEDGGISVFDVKEWVDWGRRVEGAETAPLVHFGASWADLQDYLVTNQPDIIGITNLFRENTEETIKAAEIARNHLPNSTIVVGGPNASALPNYLLDRCESIDVVALGDGEHTMLELIEWVKGTRSITDVGGIAYREETTIARTRKQNTVTELDDLGQLDYSLVKLDKYFAYERAGIMARNRFDYPGAENSVSLVTSRGCPYRCSFCSIHIHAGRKFRRYSVPHILDHIENLITNHQVKHIHFEDDNLTLDRPRFMALMGGILDRGLEFTWDTPNGVFANALDEPMMKLMKRTGCTYLIVGVESGDQWVLDNVINKQPLTVGHVTNAFRLAKKVGIDMQAFYIIGFPRETRLQIEKTLRFALDSLKQFDVIPHLNIARADPGTALYEEASTNGNLVTVHSIEAMRGKHADDLFVRYLIKNDEFTPERLERWSESFHRKSILVIGAKTLGFLVRHPRVAVENAAFFVRSVFADRGTSISDSIVKLFFCRLFYRNALLNRRAP